MTNQEAITRLTQLSAGIEWELDMSYAAALDMAIEALKAQELKNSSDCISRQAALNEIAEWMLEYGALNEKRERDALQHVARGIKKLPSVEPEPQWMPCSERLPEEDGQYLITVKYKHVDGYDDVYAEHGDWDNGKWDMFNFGHCGEVEGILAWMPLPEPYKGGEQNGSDR